MLHVHFIKSLKRGTRLIFSLQQADTFELVTNSLRQTLPKSVCLTLKQRDVLVGVVKVPVQICPLHLYMRIYSAANTEAQYRVYRHVVY